MSSCLAWTGFKFFNFFGFFPVVPLTIIWSVSWGCWYKTISPFFSSSSFRSTDIILELLFKCLGLLDNSILLIISFTNLGSSVICFLVKDFSFIFSNKLNLSWGFSAIILTSRFSGLINFFLSIKDGKLRNSPISFGMFFFVFQFCIITVPLKPLKISGTDLLDNRVLSTDEKRLTSFWRKGINFFLWALTSRIGFK